MATTKKIKVTIERGDNNLSAFIHYGDDLLTTQGDSEKEILANFIEQLEGFYELKKSEIEFDIKYDMESFFKAHQYINITAAAKVIGLNASLLKQYASGHKNASSEQLEKIQSGLRNIGKELSKVKLV